jgi:hypothetical protein
MLIIEGWRLVTSCSLSQEPRGSKFLCVVTDFPPKGRPSVSEPKDWLSILSTRLLCHPFCNCTLNHCAPRSKSAAAFPNLRFRNPAHVITSTPSLFLSSRRHAEPKTSPRQSDALVQLSAAPIHTKPSSRERPPQPAGLSLASSKWQPAQPESFPRTQPLTESKAHSTELHSHLPGRERKVHQATSSGSRACCSRPALPFFRRFHPCPKAPHSSTTKPPVEEVALSAYTAGPLSVSSGRPCC